MLTLYDPNVSNRLSLKKCQRLKRPQSARVLRASPWEQLVPFKPEGRHYSAGTFITTHDFAGQNRPLIKVNETPLTGVRGVRTVFTHSITNQHPTSSLTTYNPPPPQKGFDLYTGTRAHGIATRRVQPPDSAQQRRSSRVKPVSRVVPHTFSFVSAPSEYRRYITNQYGRPQCRAHTPYAHATDSVSLAHLSSLDGAATRRDNSQGMSIESKDFGVGSFSGLKRINKITAQEALRSPFGTERCVDLNIAQRRCRVYDTRGLLTNM